MTIAYVNQAEFSQVTSSSGTYNVTSSLTLATGDLVEVHVNGTSTAPTSVSDGLGNTYTLQGTSVNNGTNYIWTYVAQNCVSGSATVSVVGNVYAIYARQITGAATSSAVIGRNGASQTPNTTGANILNSGNIAVGGTAINILVTGLGINTQTSTPIITVGTSPLSFTGRTAVWSVFNGGTALTLPEDLRIVGATGNVAATYTVPSGPQFDNFLTIAMAYLELSAPSGATIAWIT